MDVARGSSRWKGFTIIEVLVSLLLVGMILTGLSVSILAMQRAMTPQTLGATGIRVGPSLGQFRDAALLHQFLASRVGEAKAVYVFGGTHGLDDIGIPAAAVVRSVAPLQAMAMPALTNFSVGLPSSAYGFYNAYRTELGDMESAPSARDFTVVAVGPNPPPVGALRITAFAQVRFTAESAEGRSFNAYWVRLWGQNGTYMEYRFAEPTDFEAGLVLHVGARHTWFRYSEALSIYEEGPAMLVFPDPYRPAGMLLTADESPPVSRFMYWVGGEW